MANPSRMMQPTDTQSSTYAGHNGHEHSDASTGPLRRFRAPPLPIRIPDYCGRRSKGRGTGWDAVRDPMDIPTPSHQLETLATSCLSSVRFNASFLRQAIVMPPRGLPHIEPTHEQQRTTSERELAHYSCEGSFSSPRGGLRKGHPTRIGLALRTTC